MSAKLMPADSLWRAGCALSGYCSNVPMPRAWISQRLKRQNGNGAGPDFRQPFGIIGAGMALLAFVARLSHRDFER